MGAAPSRPARVAGRWPDGARISLRVAAALAFCGLAGCGLPVQSEMEDVSRLAAYAKRYDHVVGAQNNLLDRALAECPEKTLKAVTACVRQGVDAAHPSVQALAAMVPNCRAGQVCHYDRTTRDRLGFVQASATDYVKHWRIDLDLRTRAPDAAHVPITVTDRDDFDTVPPVAPPA